MSDSIESAAPVAPAETLTPAQSATVVPSVAAATSAAPAKVELTSDKLKERLEEERRNGAKRAQEEALRELGAKDFAEVKAALEAKRKLDDEKRTELERKDREIDALKPKVARLDEVESVLREQADVALSTLTEEQRAVVKDLAGDDPAKALRTIIKLRPTWVTPTPAVVATPPPAQAAQPAPSPAVQQPLPPPATTAPPRAPSPGSITQDAPADHLKVWEELKETSPFQASRYYLLNQRAIIAAQNARSA